MSIRFTIVVFLLATPMPVDAQSIKKQTRISIGRATTYLTEPIDPEGYVDYGEAINRLNSKGVTADNNAVIPIREMCGVGALRGIETEYCQRLGLEPERLTRDATQQFDWRGRPRESDDLLFRPWKQSEFRLTASWLDENKSFLPRMRRAARCSRFYSPTVVTEDGLVLSVLPEVVYVRSCGRTLLLDAMRNLQDGHEGTVLENIFAVKQLASHESQGFTLIECLAGNYLREAALRAEAAYLNYGQPARGKRAFWERKITGRRRARSVAETIRFGERCVVLDIATRMARGLDCEWVLREYNRGLNEVSVALLQLRVQHPAVDWDDILKRINEEMSAAADSIDSDDAQERREGEQEFKRRSDKLKDVATSFRPLSLLDDPKKLNKVIPALLLAEMLPQMVNARQAELRGLAREDCVRVAWGLAIYRAEKKLWPESLSQLVPEYLPAIPKDRFDGKPLRYVVRDGDAIVYSVGINLIDDEEDIDERGGSADIGVRLRKR